VPIVKLKTFDANFTCPPFWADDTEAHKTTLMCVDAVESKYQLLNKCKLLFDLVVHQQQHLHCFRQHSVRLAKFERNFTERNFFFCHAPLHKGCPKHHGHKGNPGVTPRTCGAGGEKAQVILMWVRAPGVGNLRLNTCPNGASEVSISIYVKRR
jgi:hypothetical protein